MGDRVLAVTGDAWFDHQWGDFISVGAGGWDWFAVNLDDGTDVMLSLVRAADGTYPLVYGTLVDAAGRTTSLAHGDFTVNVIGQLDEPGDRRDLPRRLDDRSAGPEPRDPARADRQPAGAGHPGHDGRRVLGGLAAGHGHAATAGRSAARRTWS